MVRNKQNAGEKERRKPCVWIEYQRFIRVMSSFKYSRSVNRNVMNELYAMFYDRAPCAANH